MTPENQNLNFGCLPEHNGWKENTENRFCYQISQMYTG